MAEYPIKPVKRILKKHHNGEVSEETAVYVRDILVDFTEFLAKQAVQEFHLMNQSRAKNGLIPLKRLDKTSFKIVWGRIYKQLIDKNMGEVGNNVTSSLLCPKDGANHE
jgi:hypothetical protein